MTTSIFYTPVAECPLGDVAKVLSVVVDLALLALDDDERASVGQVIPGLPDPRHRWGVINELSLAASHWLGGESSGELKTMITVDLPFLAGGFYVLGWIAERRAGGPGLLIDDDGAAGPDPPGFDPLFGGDAREVIGALSQSTAHLRRLAWLADIPIEQLRVAGGPGLRVEKAP